MFIDDTRHSCGTCEHCKGSHDGDYCLEMTEHMVQNGFPARTVKIDHSARITCEYYSCNAEAFYSLNGMYPDNENTTTDPYEQNGINRRDFI